MVPEKLKKKSIMGDLAGGNFEARRFVTPAREKHFIMRLVYFSESLSQNTGGLTPMLAILFPQHNYNIWPFSLKHYLLDNFYRIIQTYVGDNLFNGHILEQPGQHKIPYFVTNGCSRIIIKLIEYNICCTFTQCDMRND